MFLKTDYKISSGRRRCFASSNVMFRINLLNTRMVARPVLYVESGFFFVICRIKISFIVTLRSKDKIMKSR